jgi:uncharacterized protein
MIHLQGKFVWFEHLSADTAAASRFYDALFGWHTETTPMGGPQPYPMIMNGSEGIGGYRAAPAGTSTMWMSYLSVRDVNLAHAAALAAGGRSLMPPTDFGRWPTPPARCFRSGPARWATAPMRRRLPSATGTGTS